MTEQKIDLQDIQIESQLIIYCYITNYSKIKQLSTAHIHYPIVLMGQHSEPSSAWSLASASHETAIKGRNHVGSLTWGLLGSDAAKLTTSLWKHFAVLRAGVGTRVSGWLSATGSPQSLDTWALPEQQSTI